MRIVGVDLAADPKATGVIELLFTPQGAVAREPPGLNDDNQLVDLARRAHKIGIDCPLGWPQSFVAALVGHETFSPWPGPDRELMRFRRTDLALIGRGSRPPLSVSTNMLGVTALRCAHLQSRLTAEVLGGQPSPRDGSGVLVEVYPAAALRVWGLPDGRYKKDPEARRGILAGLTEALSSKLDLSAVVDRCIASDHYLDALICALVAYGSSNGTTSSPPSDERVAALVEGWIHLPGRLEDLMA